MKPIFTIAALLLRSFLDTVAQLIGTDAGEASAIQEWHSAVRGTNVA